MLIKEQIKKDYDEMLKTGNNDTFRKELFDVLGILVNHVQDLETLVPGLLEKVAGNNEMLNITLNKIKKDIDELKPKSKDSEPPPKPKQPSSQFLKEDRNPKRK